MSVERVMCTSIVTVEMDDSLQVVKDIFDHVRFHHLLVVERGKVVGVVSDRDLLKAISPNIGTAAETTRDLATLKKRVHLILTRQLFTLSPESSIYDAVRVFNNHNVSCIPVVDHEQRPVGILSWRDILRLLESKLEEVRPHEE